MPFADDLVALLRSSRAIADLRRPSSSWEPVDAWRDDVFAEFDVRTTKNAFNEAFARLEQDAPRVSTLLYGELVAVRRAQEDLLQRNNADADAIVDMEARGPRARDRRPLKKALELGKTLIDSLVAILGDLLGPFKHLLTLASEAYSAYS